MKLAKILVVALVVVLMCAAAGAFTLFSLTESLPQIMKVSDYKPKLVTEVYARSGEKIGEYSRQKRTVLPYEKIPQRLVRAFIAAEDDTFFEHGGVNYVAILRAFLVNLTSGEKRQGASTITQQVARSLLLSSEKTYTRKIKEILLAQKMEQNLSKEEILYLYLNEIYFGEGAYGVAAAADTYFRKTVDKLTLAEMAILGGLPQAPSSYSPSNHPLKAKARQRYVLARMRDVHHITEAEYQQAINEPIKVYLGSDYKQVAPFFVESMRQLLVQHLGDDAVLDEGLRVYTSIDFKAQQSATEGVQNGLRVLDKRQGYRGALRNLPSAEEQEKFLLATRKALVNDKAPFRIIQPDGKFEPEKALTISRVLDEKGSVVSNIPPYVTKGQIVEGLVVKIDDNFGLTTVRFADGIGMIDIDDMGWARKADTTVKSAYAPRVTKPSAVFKPGDVILVKVVGEKFTSPRLLQPPKDTKKKGAPAPVVMPKGLPNFNEYAELSLEQKPLVEGALLSFDQKTGEVIAMVGGYEYIRNKNEFNRTIQARRQTGSAFKTIVYAAALDKGYTPATLVQDAPLVYSGQDEGQEDGKTWKPHNHGQKFEGDILFRKALIRSLNIPTVKILEDIGVPYTLDYAKRLGVFSPMNADLSLALGSSSLTLYEMTKVFANFGRLGQRVRPVVIHKVLSKDGKVLLENITLDQRFEKEVAEIDRQFEDKRKNAPLNDQDNANEVAGEGEAPAEAPKPPASPFFFSDPNQLIRPQTAYLMTTLLSGVVNEEGGTAGKARALGRPVAGKTGSTNGYVDGWFVGYTPQIATGVWVGFDEEKSMGPGEVGGDTALPIWVDYMKAAHQGLPVQDFSVPPGIVFANIDGQTGYLASSSSANVVRQAFIAGSEPKKLSGSPSVEDETDFLKKDLTE